VAIKLSERPARFVPKSIGATADSVKPRLFGQWKRRRGAKCTIRMQKSTCFVVGLCRIYGVVLKKCADFSRTSMSIFGLSIAVIT
jgi:hypothetical protein